MNTNPPQKFPSSFYANVLQQLPGLVLVMDTNSRFIYSNRYTANLFGYSNEDSMLGANAYDIRCPAVEFASNFIAQDQIIIQNGSEVTLLDIHTYANDETKILLTKKAPFYEGNELKGIICYCTELHPDAFSKISATLIQSDKKYYPANSKERSYMLDFSPKEKNLSERELECVFHLLRGRSMKEIGKELNISPRTVETHLEKIKVKLNCRNKSDIFDYGLAEGYLNYIPSKILSQNISGIIHTTNKPISR